MARLLLIGALVSAVVGACFLVWAIGWGDWELYVAALVFAVLALLLVRIHGRQVSATRSSG